MTSAAEPPTPTPCELSLAYDMRAPDFGADPVRLYRAALEQAAWADAKGFAAITLMEHHASSDGYLPSPIVLGSAVAAVTARVELRLSLVLLPLYDPIRVAEDLAVLDLVSGGRMRLTVGLGYREEEYAQFGIEMRRRPSLMEEAVGVLKQAWTGEPFEFKGRTVRILPRPAQRPRPRIAMGGASPASARRAARIADDYQPLAPRLYELYLEELAKLGKGAPEGSAPPRPDAGRYVFVTEDPDRYWHHLAPHALHDTAEYARWIGDRPGSFSRVSDPDELRSKGNYRVVTPDECLELARQGGSLTFKPLVGGLEPDLAWESLETFGQKVLPQLLAQGPSPAS